MTIQPITHLTHLRQTILFRFKTKRHIQKDKQLLKHPKHLN
jgi:hypothetical protein